MHAVCARRRADRRGPQAPGAGPAGSGQEIRTGAAVPAVIAAELRVSERSVRRWRQACWPPAWPGWPPAGRRRSAGLMSSSWPRWTCALEAALAAGWEDQRWTLAHVRDLVARKSKVQYAMPGSGTCCAAAAGSARSAPDHPGHPGPRRRHRARLGGRAGLLPARRPRACSSTGCTATAAARARLRRWPGPPRTNVVSFLRPASARIKIATLQDRRRRTPFQHAAPPAAPPHPQAPFHAGARMPAAR